MKKAVNDRRASLDEETEIKPTMRKLSRGRVPDRGASIPIEPFPEDGAEIADSPRLTLVIMDPETEWTGGGSVRARDHRVVARLGEIAEALSWLDRLVL